MNEKMSNAFRRIADIRWRGFRKSESRLGFRELDWGFWRPKDYGFEPNVTEYWDEKFLYLRVGAPKWPGGHRYFKFPLDVVEKTVVLGYIP